MATGSCGVHIRPSTVRISWPVRLLARGSPAEESAWRPQRVRRALTRRARPWSGVTKATTLCGVSRVSRMSRAITEAASSSRAVAISHRPSRPSLMALLSLSTPSAFRLAIWTNQSFVASAGRRASLSKRRRAWARRSASIEAGHTRTMARLTLWRSNMRFMVFCGWESSISFQTSSARLRSRPGRTTAPWGALATTLARSAVEGADPVVPARISGVFGG